MEGLNESEFQTLLNEPEALRVFMASETNRALLTPEQLERALEALEALGE